MKNIFIIPIVLAFFACNSSKKSVESKPAAANLFTILYSSENQGREEASHLIINNQNDLTALYQSVGNTEVPEVAFTKNQVVALFLGSRNTGGYSISIDRVEEQNDQLLIYKKEVKPSGMVTMAFTNPFVIVEIHSKKEVVVK